MWRVISVMNCNTGRENGLLCNSADTMGGIIGNMLRSAGILTVQLKPIRSDNVILLQAKRILVMSITVLMQLKLGHMRWREAFRATSATQRKLGQPHADPWGALWRRAEDEFEWESYHKCGHCLSELVPLKEESTAAFPDSPWSIYTFTPSGFLLMRLSVFSEGVGDPEETGEVIS